MQGSWTAVVSHKAACSGFRRQRAQAAVATTVKCLLTLMKAGKIFKSNPRRMFCQSSLLQHVLPEQLTGWAKAESAAPEQCWAQPLADLHR